MKSLEHKTSLIFDLFFSIVIMPLLVFLGSVYYWWRISPTFTCLTVLYLYGCYFAAKRMHLPRLIMTKSYYRLAGVIVALIAATYILTLYPLPKMDFVIPSMTEYQTRMRNYNMAITIWLMFSVVLCYSISVAFIKELYQRMILQGIAENQRDKAELSLYKAQINPHFLFNTLNSLYSLVIGTSQKAEDAFVKFTELLKYTYVTAEKDEVPVSDEIDYINNYIDLQLIRLNGHTDVVCDCLVDDGGTLIPPMIFLTFVENAFKYGASATRDCRILIRLHLKKGILTFETENRLMKHADEYREDVPVGIDNCKSRLSVLFPGRYILDIGRDGDIHKVFLKIDLRKHHE